MTSLQSIKKGVISLDLFDIEAAEKAEKSMDEFVNRRSKAKEKANAQEELLRATERRHRRKIRLAKSHAWIDYFDHLALCHERRAVEFRDRSRDVSAIVDAPADEAPGPGEEGEGVHSY
jgi:hypothetical protein